MAWPLAARCSIEEQQKRRFQTETRGPACQAAFNNKTQRAGVCVWTLTKEFKMILRILWFERSSKSAHEKHRLLFYIFLLQ